MWCGIIVAWAARDGDGCAGLGFGGDAFGGVVATCVVRERERERESEREREREGEIVDGGKLTTVFP